MKQLKLFPRWCVYTYGEPSIKGYDFVGQIARSEEGCIWINNCEGCSSNPWDPKYVKECDNVFDAIDILYKSNRSRYLTRQHWAEHIRGRFPNDFDREYDFYKSKKRERIR